MDKILIILCSFLQLSAIFLMSICTSLEVSQESIFNFFLLWFRAAKKEVKLCTEKDSLTNPTFLPRDTPSVSKLPKVSFLTQISVQ